MTNELIETAVNESFGTLGYSECENKESFKVGARVATMKLETLYEKKNKRLNANLDFYKRNYERVLGDMKTITGLIKQYTEDEH